MMNNPLCSQCFKYCQSTWPEKHMIHSSVKAQSAQPTLPGTLIAKYDMLKQYILSTLGEYSHHSCILQGQHQPQFLKFNVKYKMEKLQVFVQSGTICKPRLYENQLAGLQKDYTPSHSQLIQLLVVLMNDE